MDEDEQLAWKLSWWAGRCADFDLMEVDAAQLGDELLTAKDRLLTLTRSLDAARNEIARLNGQTFEIVDKAAIWDEGYRAGWNDYQFRTTTRNPYRKEPE